MSEQEREQFLDDIAYFWFEKGDIERFTDFSPGKLREADPALADAYERMNSATETFSRLLKATQD